MLPELDRLPLYRRRTKYTTATRASKKPAKPAITTPAFCGVVKGGAGDEAAAVLVADPVGEIGVGIVCVIQRFELIVGETDETLTPLLASNRLFTIVELFNTSGGEVCDAFDHVAVGVMVKPVEKAAPWTVVKELFQPCGNWNVLVDAACGVPVKVVLSVAVSDGSTAVSLLVGTTALVFVESPVSVAEAALKTAVLVSLKDAEATDNVFETRVVAETPGDAASVAVPLREGRPDDTGEAEGWPLRVSEAGTTSVLDDMIGVRPVAVAVGPMVNVPVATGNDTGEDMGNSEGIEGLNVSEALK
jgi:hypothetical protein